MWVSGVHAYFNVLTLWYFVRFLSVSAARASDMLKSKLNRTL